MESRNPAFPMPMPPPPPPPHYSDYGFDPQIDTFQALEEARRHGKRSKGPRAVDALRFKLQKPISKDDRSKSRKRLKWWKNAFGLFWRAGRGATGALNVSPPVEVPASASPRCSRRLTQSGPLYAAESLSGSSTPRRTFRANSGPLHTAEFSQAVVPYLSLRDLNLLEARQLSSEEPTPSPIYLVT